MTTFSRIATAIATRDTFSFSVAYGLNGSATATHRPYATDEDAKADRDAFANVLRRAGYKVRRVSLSGQRREWWGWQSPCGITCTIYDVQIIERPDSIDAIRADLEALVA